MVFGEIRDDACTKKLFFSLRKTQQKLKSQNEVEAYLTPEQVKAIATELNVKEEEVWQMHQRLHSKDHSLNQTMPGDGENEWIEWIADDRDNQEIQLAQKDEYEKRKKLFGQALQCLTKREHQTLVERRLTEPPYTLEFIAEKIKISRERVRQIENEAFLKVQKQVKRLVFNPNWQHV
nr:sigma factor-like helix-turn-helix DNA-binding protein [Candidatus Finniella inopinata]